MTLLALAERLLLERLPERVRQLGGAPSNAIDVSVVVEVGEQAYRLELSGGQVAASREPAVAERAPATFRLSLSETAFERLLVPVLDGPESASLPLRMGELDAEALELVSNVPGCLEVLVDDAGQCHRLVLGPGRHAVQNVSCTVRCEIADLRDVQSGKLEPLALLMSGRLTIEGDPQVALALGGLLLA